MSGIYLHIPFCKKACHYCDFHFTTSLTYKDDVLRAMHKELEIQKRYLEDEPIETIYFGGGTPSFIGHEEIQKLIDTITRDYHVNPIVEITLEANPDDLDSQAVKNLKSTDINRFSIGIQSFYEEDLKWMNRAHNAAEAESSVKRVQDAGFENITADLIYGYPLLTSDKWKSNIQRIIDLEIPHVSAYSMTVEPRTALASFIKNGREQAMNDSQSADQYILLMEMLQQAHFEHYETSNFAKPNYYSKHNTNYWKGISYLGIGPSAHSFNGTSRQWNVANNSKYIQQLLKGDLPAEVEILSKKDLVNEYIMTSLRTAWGMNLSKIKQDFGVEYYNEIKKNLDESLEKQHTFVENDLVILTAEGKLFADQIAADLFIIEENT